MTISPQATPPDSRQPEPPVALQFGLRALLIGISVLCAMFAVMAIVGALRSMILIWFAALIAAHVTANAWGSRRRRPGDATTEQDAGQRTDVRSSDLAQRQRMGPKRLQQVSSVSLTVLIVSALGGLTAGAGATLILASSALGDVSYAGIALGGLSAATVGGFLGFLASGFVHMGARAWREASASD